MGNMRGWCWGIALGLGAGVLGCGAEPSSGPPSSQGVVASVEAGGGTVQTGEASSGSGVEFAGAVLGAACAAAEQCASGYCVDGVCCTSACEGPCLSCAEAGLRGQCTIAESSAAECSAERLTERPGLEAPQLGDGIDREPFVDDNPLAGSTDDAGTPGSEGMPPPEACSPTPSPGCESCGPRDVCLGPGQCVPPVRSRISAGGSHTCAIRTDGRLRCWGDNFYGQLGVGNVQNVGDVDVASSGDVVDLGGVSAVQVSAANAHTCVLLQDGSVRCWGNGFLGALGSAVVSLVGDDELPVSQQPVDLGGVAVIDLSANNHRTCVIQEGGELRCWGDSEYGALGLGIVQRIGDDEPPLAVPAVALGLAVPLQVSSGAWNTCVLSSEGGVKCWGANTVGLLGVGATEPIGDNETPESSPWVQLGCEPAVQISTGYAHACALMRSGSVRCWGYGGNGALGLGSLASLGDDEEPGLAPSIDLGGAALKVVAGNAHSCALLATGQVRCWGSNELGATGLGRLETIGDDERPIAVPEVDLGNAIAVDLSTSGYHTCAVLDDESVRCWGVNELGQLGLGHTETIGDNELPSSVPPVQL